MNRRDAGDFRKIQLIGCWIKVLDRVEPAWNRVEDTVVSKYVTVMRRGQNDRLATFTARLRRKVGEIIGSNRTRREIQCVAVVPRSDIDGLDRRVGGLAVQRIREGHGGCRKTTPAGHVVVYHKVHLAARIRRRIHLPGEAQRVTYCIRELN